MKQIFRDLIRENALGAAFFPPVAIVYCPSPIPPRCGPFVVSFFPPSPSLFSFCLLFDDTTPCVDIFFLAPTRQHPLLFQFLAHLSAVLLLIKICAQPIKPLPQPRHLYFPPLMTCLRISTRISLLSAAPPHRHRRE